VDAFLIAEFDFFTATTPIDKPPTTSSARPLSIGNVGEEGQAGGGGGFGGEKPLALLFAGLRAISVATVTIVIKMRVFI